MDKVTVKLKKIKKSKTPLFGILSRILPIKYRDSTSNYILLEPPSTSQIEEIKDLGYKIDILFEKMKNGRKQWVIIKDNEQVNIVKERYSDDYIVTIYLK